MAHKGPVLFGTKRSVAQKFPNIYLIGDGGGGGANVIQERERRDAEPNPEVCHLRSYDEEEISSRVTKSQSPDLLQRGKGTG